MKHIQLLKEGIKKVQHHIAESQGRQKRVDPSSKERKEQKNNPLNTSTKSSDATEKEKNNSFILLPDTVCNELVMDEDLHEIWEIMADDEKRWEYPEYTFFKKQRITALDTDKLYFYLRRFPQHKNIKIPKSIECWPRSFLSHSCLLNIMISPTLKYLGPIFWKCIQFENNLGGRIYYTGTKIEWKELLESCPTRSTLGLDYTNYNSIVEFVDESFQLPEIDYHIIKNDNEECVREQIRYCTYSGDITVPISYTDCNGKEHKISGIGMLSFAYNGGIEKVIIPSEIEVICMDAFRGCKNLKELYICESDKIITIEAGAFCECDNLVKVYIGRIAYIQPYAFAKEAGPQIVVDSVQDMNDRAYVHETAFKY